MIVDRVYFIVYIPSDRSVYVTILVDRYPTPCAWRIPGPTLKVKR